MKKITLLMSFLLTIFIAKAQCDYVVDMQDSYGDGWNGASIDMSINGVVMTSFTVTAADGSAATGSYSTYTGDNVEFYFNSGTWDTEITFQITAPDGSSVGSYGPYSTSSGNDQSIWTGVSNSTCTSPSCLDPYGLSAGNGTSSSIDVSWTGGPNATSYNVEYGVTGYTQGSGTTTTASTASTTITGLTAYTVYDIYVQADCGANGTSNWAGPISYSTCPGAAPYLENFDATPASLALTSATGPCWTQSTNDVFDWIINNGPTTSQTTGPSDDITGGGNYMYTETSVPRAAGDSAILISPAIDISSLTSAEISFQLHMYGASMGTLRVDASSDGGTTFNTIWTKTGDQGDLWTEEIVQLSGFTTTAIVRFVSTVGVDAGGTISYWSDMAIDNFQVRQSATCPQTSPLTASNVTSSSADVSWTAGGTETSWNVEYGAAGFTLGTGTFTNVTSTTYSMTGLTPSTDYDVYVQAVCSPSDLSYWVGPLTISNTFVQPGCGDAFGPYCYDANAYTVFTATANPGDFIKVDITAGETEVGYDNLEFYDGVGNTGNLLYSADGDHTGVSVLSTSGVITMYIDGDAIWNCVDGVGGPYVPIELTITCTTPSALDIAGRAMTTSPSLILSNGPFTISGDLQNMGSNTVTSMDVNYSVDGGATVTENVSGLSLATGDYYNFNHGTTWSPAAGGTYDIVVWATNINGSADMNNSNDMVSGSVTVFANAVVKRPLLEVFTSSTCGPCVAGNVNVASVLTAYSDDQYSLLNYQMSWPGSGDSYYTLEGGDRRTYYNVNSVPDVILDGNVWQGNSSSLANSQVDAVMANPAFVDLSSSHTVTGQTLDFTVAINPLGDFTGPLTLYSAVFEYSTYNNVGSNGETQFSKVMKKMIPGSMGFALPTLQTGVPVLENFSHTFQGSYTLPPDANSPIDHSIEHSIEDFNNLGVVTWIQNDVTKEILQSTVSVSAQLQLCSQPALAPTNENFDAGFPVCWSQEANDQFDWSVDNLGTPSVGTGPSDDFTGITTGTSGNYMFTEASLPRAYGDVATMYSEVIDISGLTNPELRFLNHMYGSAIGTLSVDLWDAGTGTNLGTVFTHTGDRGDVWNEELIMLSTTATLIQFSITATLDSNAAGQTWPGDMAIDEFGVREAAANDLALVAAAVASGCDLTATEPIELWVVNQGLVAESAFDLSYALNGGTPVVESITSTLNPGDTLKHVFAATADMTADGVYNLDFACVLSTDNDPADNTMMSSAENYYTPMAPVTMGDTICNGDTAMVSADEYSYWYDAATGGNLVGEGDEIDVMPTATTSYYAEAAATEGHFEDFDSYNVGDYIVASDPNNWATWPGGTPGGAYDMQIDDAQGNGGNSLRVDNADGTDVILEFGEAFSTGYFYYSMDMYIVGDGYINFQEQVTIGAAWNMSITFIGGVINIDVDGASVLTGAYSTTATGGPVWNTFEFECDYSTGTWEVFANGTSQGTFVNPDPVASVNIYPGVGVEYYLDNVEWGALADNACRSATRTVAVVTVNNPSSGTDLINACDSLTWIDGITYTASNNTATYTLQTIAGCDSIVTLDLTMNNSASSVDVLTACDSLTWIDGITYTSSNNTATYTLQTIAGCDSLVSLDLNVNNSSSATDIQTSCNSFTWIDGVTYTSSNNTATYTLVNAAGCDSIISLNLTLNQFNLGFTESSTLFTAPPFSVQFTNNTPNLSNYNFTWDFGDSTIIQNNNSSVFQEYVYNGLYSVTLIAEDIINGCGIDSLTKQDLIYCSGGPNLSIIEISNKINVFPNPTNENISISVINFNGKIQTEVYDLIGNRLQTTNETTISLRNYARGVYILKVAYGDRVEEIKVIKD